MCRQAAVFATRRVLVCGNDLLISFPEIGVTVSGAAGRRNLFPQLATGVRAAITNDKGCDLAGRQSAIQIHRFRLFFRTNDQSSSSSNSVAAWSAGSGIISVVLRGASGLFFEPVTDRFARHPKGALEAAQGTALLVSFQNLLFFSITVTGRLRVFATDPTAVAASESLLMIPGEAVTNELFTSAKTTFESDGDHIEDDTRSNLNHPLPKNDSCPDFNE